MGSTRTILNEIDHSRSRDPKQGLVLYWPWVILDKLGHGGSGDQKRGFGMKAGTLVFITSLFQLTMFLSEQIVITEKKDTSQRYTSVPYLTHFFHTHCRPFTVLRCTHQQWLFHSQLFSLLWTVIILARHDPPWLILLRMVNGIKHVQTLISILATSLMSILKNGPLLKISAGPIYQYWAKS